MLRVDETDERTTWILIHVVVWEIFEFIGLSYVFSSLAILNSIQLYTYIYARIKMAVNYNIKVINIVYLKILEEMVIPMHNGWQL